MNANVRRPLFCGARRLSIEALPNLAHAKPPHSLKAGHWLYPIAGSLDL